MIVLWKIILLQEPLKTLILDEEVDASNILTYHIATKISTTCLATRMSIFAISVQRHNKTTLHICKYAVQVWEKKFKMADSQSQPENKLKRHVLVWVKVALLINRKVNLGNFPADSDTRPPCINIKTFELNFQSNFQLNFERFDVNFTFFMLMSHAKLETTKTKHQEQVWNILEMHPMMTSRSLWISRRLRIVPWLIGTACDVL